MAVLGWTPDQFWESTPHEFWTAIEGHQRANRPTE